MDSNTEEFKFGVVITSYNRPDFLLNAMRSVEQQELPAHEIVVVDDNSDFDVHECLSDFSHLPLTIVTKEQGRGASHSRNLGAKTISEECDYIAFLDDDDAFLPNRLSVAASDFAERPECEAALCSYDVMDGSKRKVTPLGGWVDQEKLRTGNVYCGTSGLVMKRTLTQSERFDEEVPSGEDWELFARLSQRGKFYFNSDPLYLYRIGNHASKTSQKRKLTIEQVEARFAAANKQRSWLGEVHYKTRIANQILGDLGSKQQAWKWINFSLKRAGFVVTTTVMTKLLLAKLSHSKA